MYESMEEFYVTYCTITNLHGVVCTSTSTYNNNERKKQLYHKVIEKQIYSYGIHMY